MNFSSHVQEWQIDMNTWKIMKSIYCVSTFIPVGICEVYILYTSTLFKHSKKCFNIFIELNKCKLLKNIFVTELFSVWHVCSGGINVCAIKTCPCCFCPWCFVPCLVNGVTHLAISWPFPYSVLNRNSWWCSRAKQRIYSSLYTNKTKQQVLHNPFNINVHTLLHWKLNSIFISAQNIELSWTV